MKRRQIIIWILFLLCVLILYCMSAFHPKYQAWRERVEGEAKVARKMELLEETKIDKFRSMSLVEIAQNETQAELKRINIEGIRAQRLSRILGPENYLEYLRIMRCDK